MRLKHIVLGMAVASLVGASALVSQASADTLIPLFSYRTGPFANSGIPIANGMHDYMAMLNARDGGIGGSKIIFEECETGYKNEKGVECYESLKSKKPAIITPYSTTWRSGMCQYFLSSMSFSSGETFANPCFS